MDQNTVTEGIGGFVWGGDAANHKGAVNVRQRYIQGISTNSGIVY